MLEQDPSVAPLNCQESTETDEEGVVAGSNDFTLNLLRELHTQPANGEGLVASGWSVVSAFALVDGGADDSSAATLRNTFGWGDLDRNGVAQTVCALNASLIDDAADNSHKLSIASGAWFDDSFTVNPTYRDFLAVNHNADAIEVDFDDDPETAAARINEWAAQNTNDLIREVVSPAVVSDWIAALANAVYFKGDWASPFDESLTDDLLFTLADGSEVYVATMQQVLDADFVSTDDFDLVVLPYEGGDIEMVALLPSGGRLDDLIDQLSTNTLTAALDSATDHSVDLRLPKFTSTSDHDLVQPLRSAGLSNLFDTPELNEIGTSPTGPLTISSVRQGAKIIVDETGTEAAAVTVIGVTTESVELGPPPAKFHADSPFLYLLRDVNTGLILFAGTVTNPAA